MAKQGGGYAAAAYQQLRPIETDFGQIAKDAADREIAAQDKRDLEAKARQEKQAKISENFKTDYNTLTDVITNTKSIDEAFARGITSARDMTGQIYKEIQSNPRLANDVDTQMKLGNLRNFSQKLKTASDVYAKYSEDMASGMQSGKYSAWNESTLNTLDSIFGQKNLQVSVDPKSGLPIASTIKVDSNGEPVLDENGNKIIEEVPLQAILNGEGLEDTVNVYELTEEARKVGEKLGKKVKSAPQGAFGDKSTQEFSMVEDDVRNLVQGYIGTASRPTDIAKSIWTDVLGNDRKELNDDDMKAIEDAFVSKTKPFYDEVVTEKIDRGAQQSAARLAQDKKEAEAKAKTTSTDFTVVTDENEKIKKVNYKGRVRDDGGGQATVFALPTDPKTKESSLEVIGKEGDPVMVNKVYLLDDGTLAYSGFKIKGKVSGEDADPDGYGEGTISRVIRGEDYGGEQSENDPVLTAVAKAYGLDNEGQLKKKLQSKIEGFGKKEGSAKDVSKMTAAEKIEYYKNN